MGITNIDIEFKPVICVNNHCGEADRSLLRPDNIIVGKKYVLVGYSNTDELYSVYELISYDNFMKKNPELLSIIHKEETYKYFMNIKDYRNKQIDKII